jgi:hypothetical protein
MGDGHRKINNFSMIHHKRGSWGFLRLPFSFLGYEKGRTEYRGQRSEDRGRRAEVGGSNSPEASKHLSAFGGSNENKERTGTDNDFLLSIVGVQRKSRFIGDY